jgi:pyridoxal phosphate enzyme (YggS family)
MNEQEKSELKKLISANLETVRKNIRSAALRAGRNPDDIILVAVTKTFGAEVIDIALELGLKILGESRVQEAREKFQRFGNRADWHLVGHLQKNKVKYALEIFKLIHSVDSLELAEEISRRAGRGDGRKVDILLQVNVGEEKNKFGFPPAETATLAKKIAELPNLRIRGFMAIPPKVENPEESRPWFRRIMEIKNEVRKLRLPSAPAELASFGMSSDYEVAVEEGATHVRVGTAIFGTRDA